MPINELYHTWMQQICELRPNQRITQQRNFVWLMIGIYQSHSVYLSKIAGKIPGPAKLVSITRRLSRFWITRQSMFENGMSRLHTNGWKPNGVVWERSV